MYGLKIDETGRIMHIVPEKFATPDHILVETIPDGNVTEYRYENGEYIHDPVETKPEPAPLTIEERVAALEKTIAVPDYAAGKWYYRGDNVTFEGAAYTCIAPEDVVCVWSPTDYPTYWQKKE